MSEEFLIRLFTPSPIMHWLLTLLPVTILISGAFGAAERGRNNRRLTLWAAILTVWLFIPYGFADPLSARISAMGTILLWLGLVGYWARHVWDYWPSPVWAHATVITHLVAIGVAAVVALYRAIAA